MYCITYILFSMFMIYPFLWRLDIPIKLATITSALGGWILYFAGRQFSYAIFG